MRRFIRTYFVRRVAQVTVLRDAEARTFEIWVWRAAARTCDLVETIPCPAGTGPAKKIIALDHARALAEAEGKVLRDEERGPTADVDTTARALGLATAPAPAVQDEDITDPVDLTATILGIGWPK